MINQRLVERRLECEAGGTIFGPDDRRAEALETLRSNDDALAFSEVDAHCLDAAAGGREIHQHDRLLER
ncbi:hypothetical protein GS397_22525 [Sphingobium yanoikuyae]|jgi:hypothetical protein|uniref:Uncharacterized protein n=1 Tax=Sphingobium yanoikuyae TaxID=13690 RepID=A0A3G2UT89_SPHYA|nr:MULTISPECIES: hypothetical protein [Sphingomonadaceae]RSU70646.1 hypothetical protein BRX37_22460 [Sphingomonas sp. S-NIH.Pt3_0716]AYO75871.1 hypothetical protein EBF16_02630 [Sphingobium yanoikuyae]MBP8233069.1 hypothetical protein [Rhizorhabdus sp.]MDG2515108.1 hypothetical protein [Sphingobium yanoikuyae]PHP19199.1 hypothetical protein CG471_13765 [Sphingobium sp. IP1]